MAKEKKKGNKISKEKKTEINDSGKEKESKKQVNESADVKEDVDIGGKERVSEGGKYSKRKIESNWSRYEEPEVDELMVEDKYDETKDFEYIRLNASATASSHFKFKAEKEWESKLNDESNGDQVTHGLDLNLLGVEIRENDILEKLGLRKLIQEECKYCVAELGKSTSNSTEDSSHLQTLSNVSWSFEGLEKYMPLIEINVGHDKQDGAADSLDIDDLVNSEETNNLRPELIQNINNDKEYRDQNCEIVNESDHLSISTSANESNDELNDLLKDMNVGDASSNDLTMNNGSVNINDINDPSIPTSDEPNKVDHNELDLDMLLEMDTVPAVADVKHRSDGKETEGDLDQWLDDILT